MITVVNLNYGILEHKPDMLKKWLSLMLLVLIACQSVWVMADSHPFDQTNAGHTESSHTHGFADKTHPNIADKSALDSNSDMDGHHCHSSAHLFISFFSVTIAQPIVAANPLNYSSTHNAPYLPLGQRPPIA